MDYKIFEKREDLNLSAGYGIQLSVNSTKLLNKIGFKNLPAKLSLWGINIGIKI